MSETATTPGYGTIPTAGYTQERRPMRPPMVIIRTGSYGYGSFGRLPPEGLRQRTRRTNTTNAMKEAEPLLEANADEEEDEEAATGRPPRAAGSVDGTLPERDTKDDEEELDDDDDEEETKSTGYLILLTLGIGG